MIVGVTGSLAALGDTLFPASSLANALAQDFSATSGWLVRWRWTHPTVAFLASILLVWLLVRAAQRRSAWDNRGLSALVLALLALAIHCWGCWMSSCSPRSGSRLLTCSALTFCGPRWSCSPRGSR